MIKPLLALFLAATTVHAQKYDIVISGGTVIDGTGAARYRADVGVNGDNVAIVSRTPISKSDGKKIIDAGSGIVSPGFIDLHAHLEPLPELARREERRHPGDGHPQPRSYGTFPRVLGQYARDDHVITLEQGVYKMTGMPAKRLGLADRGVLKAGAAADVVVFDAAKIADQATFAEPHQYATGIDEVLVNGVLAIDHGRYTDSRAGKILRHR